MSLFVRDASARKARLQPGHWSRKLAAVQGEDMVGLEYSTLLERKAHVAG
jgi:hypothetical protein